MPAWLCSKDMIGCLPSGKIWNFQEEKGEFFTLVALNQGNLVPTVAVANVVVGQKEAVVSTEPMHSANCWFGGREPGRVVEICMKHMI